MITKINNKQPIIKTSCFVAENASVIGEVEIGEDCGVWFGAVIRADSNKIRIGNRTNIQDVSVIHIDHDHDASIGDDVTIGHRAIIHGCHIGNRCIIGMGAIVMNGAKIGEDCIIGAGALVTEGAVIPPKSLVIGFPAKVKRELTEEEVKLILKSSEHYAENAKNYIKSA